jgi:hypothetical protein
VHAQAGYAARPNSLLNADLAEPEWPRCSSSPVIRSPLRRSQNAPAELVAAPSRSYLPGASAQLLALAASDSTIHDLLRNHAQTGRLNGALHVGPRFFCRTAIALPDRCIQRASGSGRLRCASTPSTRRHTLAFPNAFTRRRALESARVCLHGWRSRSDWKPGGHSKRRASDDSIERHQNAGRANSMRSK